MPKLLVNNPSGLQEVVEVMKGGGYFDPSRVLWDERVHGPMPEIVLGGMVVEEVNGKRSLKIDSALLQEFELREAAAQQAKADRIAARQLRIDTIKKIKAATTILQMREGLTALIDHLMEEGPIK